MRSLILVSFFFSELLSARGLQPSQKSSWGEHPIGRTLASAGALSLDIQIQQGKALLFDVQVRNSTSQSQRLSLTTEASLISRSLEPVSSAGLGKKETSVSEKFLSWVVPAKKSLQLRYEIPFDPKKFYYISSEEKWVPVPEHESITQIFQVSLRLQPGHQMIHSATGLSQDSWALAFGPYVTTSSSDGRIRIHLMGADAQLAKTLMDRLQTYLNQFEKDIGPYPYNSFSVVESPDEIGYAFPKMTWMGTQLLRFPFILTTSLPHELLHSWWGNGVFVDYKTGNWCEGLTSFGADYALLSESEKKVYRLRALSNYENYVKKGKEISLSEFISRGEDRALQAIGYDKALMVFVMLEQQLGPDTFQLGLRRFYKSFKFKTASYHDLFRELEKASGQKLSEFEKFWIHSPGALGRSLLTAQQKSGSTESTLVWRLNPAEAIRIPAHPISAQALLESGAGIRFDLRVNSSGTGLLQSATKLPANSQARGYQLDPDFFLFRQLAPDEKPAIFSAFFGQTTAALGPMDQAWMGALKNQFSEISFQAENWESASAPVFLVSLEEALRIPEIQKALGQKMISVQSSSLFFGQRQYDLNSASFFATLRIRGRQVVVMSLPPQGNIPRLFQRWTRYGGQSYVILAPTSGAQDQGIWIDPFWTPL
jgi:hypothetical protein